MKKYSIALKNPFAYINNVSLSTASTFSSPRACSFLPSCCCCCCFCFCFSFYLITKKCSKRHSAVSLLSPPAKLRLEVAVKRTFRLLLSSFFLFFSLFFLFLSLSFSFFLFPSLSFSYFLFVSLSRIFALPYFLVLNELFTIPLTQFPTQSDHCINFLSVLCNRN